MSLFYRLILAHMIADFPLQTKQIFNIKMNTKWGVLLHSSIVLLFSILLSFPYLENSRVILIIIIVFVTHTIIDKIKLDYSKKTSNQGIKIFLIDQFLHISIIAALTINFTKTYLITSPFSNTLLNYLIDVYNNDILIIYMIGYIASVFFIPILLIYIKEEDVSNVNLKKSPKQKALNIKIPANKMIDKIYRLILTISTQYLAEQYVIIIFIIFAITNLISYQLSSGKTESIYNLKSILNSSLAIFIGEMLKFV
ncbi:MAG: DUF3307 domain-containing protein [Candidatus Caldatribacteriota bacterium]|nr:DUF3307 domain-containing protein [Candidatus Caldatribacteriota bacterium]